MLSKDNASTRQVERRTFAYHEGKGGKQDSVKISYWVGMSSINEWLGPAHTGFFKSKSDRWWRKHGGQAPFPKTVLEFMERQNELLPTGEIVVKPNGKYWEVVDAMPGAANNNVPEASNDNEPAWLAEIGDEVPF